MKNIDVVALLNPQAVPSKKERKAQRKAEAEIDEAEVDSATEAEESVSVLESVKESAVGQKAEELLKKASEHKLQVALAAAGVAVLAVVAGVVTHKQKARKLKLLTQINNKKNTI